MDIFDFAPPLPIDFVVSSLLTHHMSDDLIVKFLRWMEHTARRGWMIYDLQRHRGAIPFHRLDRQDDAAASHGDSRWPYFRRAFAYATRMVGAASTRPAYRARRCGCVGFSFALPSDACDDAGGDRCHRWRSGRQRNRLRLSRFGSRRGADRANRRAASQSVRRIPQRRDATAVAAAWASSRRRLARCRSSRWRFICPAAAWCLRCRFVRSSLSRYQAR